MRLQALVIATLLCATPSFVTSACADTTSIHIENPYARTNGAAGATGAIFMTIMNHANTDDRLIATASDAAEKVELHTHTESEGGVMSMSDLPEGLPIAAMQIVPLQRGGDHIMLMGLHQALKDGDIIHLTLTFEKAGEVKLDVPVDNARKPEPAMDGMQGMDHSTMKAPAEAPAN